MAADRETQAIIGDSAPFKGKVQLALIAKANASFLGVGIEDKKIAKAVTQQIDVVVASVSRALAAAGLDMTSTDASLDTAVNTAWNKFIGISLGVVAAS